MHILILVTTLLMLLSIVASTRFELFLTSMGVRTAYEKYMEEDERSFYNAREKGKYDKPERNQGEAADKTRAIEKARSTACSKLNVQPLFEENTTVPQEYYDAVKQTFTRLILANYSDKKFFKDTEAAALVDRIIEYGKQEVCGAKVTQVRNLAQINLRDAVAQEVFYLMLKGGGEELDTKESYPSLLNSITFRSAPVPIRVYLAKRPLLRALFYDNPGEVDKVIQARRLAYDHYHDFSLAAQEVLAEVPEDDCEAEPPQLTSTEDLAAIQAGTGEFASSIAKPTDVPESFLDWTVSGTVPPL